MDQELVEVLQNADWKRLTLLIEGYADNVLRRYLWRGLRVTVGPKGQLLAAGKSADDFVMEAMDALLKGTRQYDYELSLEHNLRRTIESAIWNWKKKSDRQPLLDHRPILSEDGKEFDPITAATDPRSAGASEVEKNERRGHLKLLFEEFEASLQNDTELSLLFDAYKSGFEKPAEIEELTNIPAARIYELKRKLVAKLNKFKSNHPSAEAAGLQGVIL
jgi:hypothetical protein